MKVYNITEATKILKVSRETMYNWLRSGKIKYTTLPNGQKRIPESELKKYTEVD